MRNIASLWHSIYQRLEADSDKLENSSVVAGSRRRVVRFTARAPPRRPGGLAGWLARALRKAFGAHFSEGRGHVHLQDTYTQTREYSPGHMYECALIYTQKHTKARMEVMSNKL